MTRDEQFSLLEQQREVILRENAFLTSTDYIAAKIAEGAATKTEYKAKIQARAAARERINAAEAEIARLEGLEVEEPELAEREAE